ncbi:hypothetical protein, partial [Nocardia mangyaensis]|uniref:hypothetical protein n=1 Tax=Nocardia mangyaensis TaxID=2213200 RepID=UPI002674BCE3
MASCQSIPFYTDQTLILKDNISDESRVRELHHKFVGVLKISSVNSGTMIDAKIEHSYNGEDWFDLMIFDQFSTPNSQIIYLSEQDINVLPHVRGNVTLSGSNPM